MHNLIRMMLKHSMLSNVCHDKLNMILYYKLNNYILIYIYIYMKI